MKNKTIITLGALTIGIAIILLMRRKRKPSLGLKYVEFYTKLDGVKDISEGKKDKIKKAIDESDISEEQMNLYKDLAKISTSKDFISGLVKFKFKDKNLSKSEIETAKRFKKINDDVSKDEKLTNLHKKISEILKA